MSIRVMTYIWEHSRQQGSALLVLLAIADWARDDGSHAFPTVAMLARKTRLSARSVQRILRSVEEAGELHEIARELELSPIILMTPTNTSERLKLLADAADGFIYTVARKGVTGSSTDMNQDVVKFIERCRQFTDLPLAVGFGVSQKQDIEFIARHADIAVIGTAALKAWEESQEKSLRAFFQKLLA